MSIVHQTIEGPQTVSYDDDGYIDYLDDLADVPSGHSFGLLLFKADPVAFRQGRDEWLASHG